MNSLKKLLENKWVKKFINFLESSSVKITNAVKLDFIDGLFKKLRKTKRGAPLKYKPSQLFKLIMKALQEGKRSARAIARYAKKLLVKIVHKLKGDVSHDTISRFFIKLNSVVKHIFYKLVRIARKIGLLVPALTQVEDSTDLPTRFKKDKDAKWSYDATRKRYYFGYGTLLSVDPYTHLPTAAKLTTSKKINRGDCREVTNTVIKVINPSVIVGDGEFDIIELLEEWLEKNVLLIAPYNKRNSHEELPIRFRAELYGFDRKWMLEESKYRLEVEHAISTLKEHFGLTKINVKGWEKVETHLFLVLCLRLLHGIATFKQGKDPRKVTLI